MCYYFDDDPTAAWTVLQWQFYLYEGRLPETLALFVLARGTLPVGEDSPGSELHHTLIHLFFLAQPLG